MNKAEIEATVGRMFAEASGLTRDLTVTVTGGGEGGAPAIYSAPGAIITPIPASRVDGTNVLPNDEHLRLRAAALPPNTVLKPGDYFTGMTDGLTRNIITAHLDAAGVLWTCAVRRSY